MAKTAVVNRDKKRREIVKKYAVRRKVTLQPIGMPSRSLNCAIDFFALLTTARWPAIAVISAAAASTRFLSCVASPTPMLMTIFSMRGISISFL